MNSETTIVARQYRLQEWANLVCDCNNRPDKMTIKQWCEQHSISTANYYYRLTEVRKACLETNASHLIKVLFLFLQHFCLVKHLLIKHWE